MIKGYARVSTDGQDLATQHELLKDAGAELVFSEKQSGMKTNRAALARCMASLEPGDTVFVTKLDRLARSTRDLLNTLATIGEAGASFRSLGDPWADTTTPHGRLMLTVLGRAGRVRAPSDPEPNQRRTGSERRLEVLSSAGSLSSRSISRPKLWRGWRSGETLTAIARTYNVSHMTISRLAGVAIMQ